MLDEKLIYLDSADIATSPVSNVIKFNAATDLTLTNELPRIAKNVRGANHLNVVVNAPITGSEVVTLEDSADGSSWAAVPGGVIPVGAAAQGDVFSILVPLSTRIYTRVAETVGTVGVISVFLGPQVSKD